MNKRPPYQTIADVGSFALVVFVILAYRFFPAATPDWSFVLAYAVATVVLGCIATEIFLLWREYRAGFLYPMRNASLFILLLSLVGLPVYLVYLYATDQPPGPSTLLLVPVMLVIAVRNLFRVRIDQLSVLAKTGFRPPTEIPLFRIESVEEKDDRLTVTPAGEGRTIQLIRTFFFPRHWEAITTKLRKLSH